MDDIVIFGMGGGSEEYISLIKIYKKQYNIIGIIDKNIPLEIKRIKEIPILQIDIIQIKCFIIISDYNWDIAVSTLKAIGKQRGKDFEVSWYIQIENKNCISYNFLLNKSEQTKVEIKTFIDYFRYNKKVAAVFGNCQITYIINILLRVKYFIDDYSIINLPMIHYADKEGLNNKVMKEIDLLFYQPVKQDNRFSKRLCSKVILSMLNESCIYISFPNVYFTGYFPQYIQNRHNLIRIHNGKVGLIPYGDSILEKLYIDNMPPYKIIDIINSDELFTKQNIIENAENSLTQLKEREKLVDIKISDYIEKYYRKELLFYTPNHPSNNLMTELTRRLLEKVNINVKQINTDGIHPNDYNELIIYSCVQKHLELNFRKLEFSISNILYPKRKMSIIEYASIYQEFCFADYRYRHKKYNLEKSFYINEEVARVLYSDIDVRNELINITILLSLKREIKKDDILFYIPFSFAPFRSFITYGINKLSLCEWIDILISTDGKAIYFGESAIKDKQLIIHTCYHID